jgi:hypothetical protein
MQAKKRVKANSSATANVSVRRSVTRNRVHDAPPAPCIAEALREKVVMELEKRLASHETAAVDCRTDSCVATLSFASYEAALAGANSFITGLSPAL